MIDGLGNVLRAYTYVKTNEKRTPVLLPAVEAGLLTVTVRTPSGKFVSVADQDQVGGGAPESRVGSGF